MLSSQFSAVDLFTDDFKERIRLMKAADQAYYQILEKIISLQIPPGALLQERALAEDMEMSRTSVREAIQRLAQDGWLSVKARSHILIKPVTESDISEIFELRYLIEPPAIGALFEKKLARPTAVQLQPLLDEMGQLRDSRFAFMKFDQTFHLHLVSQLGNGRLTRFCEILILENVRIGLIAMTQNKRFHEVMVEHGRIFEAMLNRRKREALLAIRDHLEVTRAEVYRNLTSFAR